MRGRDSRTALSAKTQTEDRTKEVRSYRQLSEETRESQNHRSSGEKEVNHPKSSAESQRSSGVMQDHQREESSAAELTVADHRRASDSWAAEWSEDWWGWAWQEDWWD